MPLFGPPNVDKLKAKRDLPGLTKALGYKQDSSLRRAAAEALGQLGDARAVEPLIGALGDETVSVRQAAVGALGELDDARAVEPLIGLLHGKDRWSVRDAAVLALGRLGDARAVEPLIGLLHDEDGSLVQKAVEALTAIGASAVEPLIDALDDKDEYVRGAAVGALRAIGDVRAVDPELVALRGEVEPLVAALESDERSRGAMEQLVSALERSLQSIDADLLRRVGLLRDQLLLEVSESICYEFRDLYGGTIDCSQVKQLARQELIRRGLRA
jgi:HEAT repeat protein